MRVLLVNPSDTMLEIMGGARVFVHKTEPLGILYIAAVLEQDGHEVGVIDAWGQGLSLADVKARLEEERWDVVGINTLTSSGAWVYDLGGFLKERHPDTTVVLGNIHASVYAGFYLEQGRCDVVVHGEGEYIMRNLVRALAARTPLAEVGGISYLEGGAVRQTGRGPVPMDLDELPFPARHLVDMDRYSWREFVTAKADRGRYRVMMATRGCPFACTFCVVNADRNYRMRSAASIVDELQLLVERYDASFVEFLDPLFTVNKARIIEVCQEIVRRGIEVEWQCEGHVNTVNEEVLAWMARAGCRTMAFGIETASPEIIKQVRKGSSIHRVKGAVEMATRAGIRAHGLFILGFPGETREQAEATIRFARSLPLDFAQFAILVPYPGSDIYHDLVARGLLDTEATPEEKVANWRRFSAYLSFTDLEPMYVPEGWTPEELKALQRKAIRSFYLRPRQILKEIRKFRLRNWRSYAEGIRTVFLPRLPRRAPAPALPAPAPAPLAAVAPRADVALGSAGGEPVVSSVAADAR